jgi:hypothetical protein
MNKLIRYLGAYVMWIAQLGLALWLAYLSKEVFLDILALFYKKGSFAYLNAANFADKVFTILLGLSWLAFMIIVEAYFRAGAGEGDLMKRFANVTGPVLLCIFAVDLISFWIHGVTSSDWLRWLILMAELSIGMVLLVSVKTRSTSTS